jgi:hypothetical protein
MTWRRIMYAVEELRRSGRMDEKVN